MTNLARLYRQIMSRYTVPMSEQPLSECVCMHLHLLLPSSASSSSFSLSPSSTSSEAGISHLDADRMAWIPNKILHSYYQNSSEDRLCVERCLLSCLIPVTLPVEDRMQRTSHVYCRLDDHASRAFEQLLRNREQYILYM